MVGARLGDYMAFWKVFIDDSADQHKKKFVVAGIFVAKLATWQKFQKKWNQECRNVPRIKYFHGKELRSFSGEFRQFLDKKKWPGSTGGDAAYAKRDRLRDVVESFPIAGFGVGLYVPVYEEIRASEKDSHRYLGKDAFEYILQVGMYRAARQIRQFDKNAKIAFVSDNSNKAPRYTKVYAAWSKANPNTARHLMGIAHLNDEHWPGLQAADMAASIVKDMFERHQGSEESVLPYVEEIPLLDRFFRIDNINKAFHMEMLSNQSSIERTIDV